MIKIVQYNNLSDYLKNLLADLAHKEFGDFPIVANTKWASPDWVVLYFEDDHLVSYYNLIERYVMLDGEKLKAAGLNNLVTPEVFRRKGYATKLLAQTYNFFFNELKSDLGLLLCADNLIPFYEKLNWYRVKCPVIYNQPDGNVIWQANTMLLTRSLRLNPNKIDLNGLPW